MTYYRDMQGKLIKEDPFNYSRLYRVGQEVVMGGVFYRVIGAAIIDGEQHVNVVRV